MVNVVLVTNLETFFVFYCTCTIICTYMHGIHEDVLPCMCLQVFKLIHKQRDVVHVQHTCTCTSTVYRYIGVYTELYMHAHVLTF